MASKPPQTARERQKERELMEARQAGTAAPALDKERGGEMINPHNPEFLTKKPWYLGDDAGPTLSHQGVGSTPVGEVSLAEAEADVARRRSAWKAQTAGDGPPVVPVGTWIEALRRGKAPHLPCKVKAVRLDGTLDVEFENGQIGRRTPRAHCKLPKSAMGARAGLEKLGKVAYDAKRDRWHGYDGDGYHQDQVKKYEEQDAARAARQQSKPQSDDDSDSDAEDQEDDGYRQNDAGATDFQKRFARQGGVGGAQMKTTVRNLRIREDTAKYLRNLDPESAFYDPKSRAMRENPTPHLGDPKDLIYAGDNFARATGDALELAKTSCFAWDAERRGTKAGGDVVHTQADPSRTELARRDFEKKRKEADAQKQREIAERYGSAAASDDPDERALRGARATSERYVEYGADGRVIKGAPVAARQSRYAEDVHESGHDCVWGSYFCAATFRWGYADDHSTTRHSYATGEAGRRANDAAVARMTQPVERPMLANSSSGTTAAPPSRASLYGEADAAQQLDEAKVREAMARQKPTKEEGDGKRKYNSLATTDVTAEEMEAYRRTKVAKDDPMAKFLGE